MRVRTAFSVAGGLFLSVGEKSKFTMSAVSLTSWQRSRISALGRKQVLTERKGSPVQQRSLSGRMGKKASLLSIGMHVRRRPSELVLCQISDMYHELTNPVLLTCQTDDKSRMRTHGSS